MGFGNWGDPNISTDNVTWAPWDPSIGLDKGIRALGGPQYQFR